MRYLSLEWIEAMHSQVTASESLMQLAQTQDIGVTQVVTNTPDGTVTYHLQVGNGEVRFGAGPAPKEHVRLEQSWETAVGVATSILSAQEVFIKGHIRVRGDTRRLVEATGVFAALSIAFEAIRAETDYEHP